MALKKRKEDEVDLITVTYGCRKPGCSGQVSATIWPGDRKPPKYCGRCKGEW